jgi:uncharacterized protein (TIGR02300 family)
MPELGKKYTCYSCHTKFYDLGKPEPICPKCGADQRDAEEAPVTTGHRSRASRAPVVEEPIEDEFPAEGEAAPAAEAESEEEEDSIAPEREPEPEEEEDEEEEY